HDNWTFGYLPATTKPSGVEGLPASSDPSGVAGHPGLVVAAWVGNNDNSPMVDVDGVTGAGPIWHRSVEAAIDLGYVRGLEITPPEGEDGVPRLELRKKCLNASCSRTELIYQEPDRTWYSDLESGHYCLEDFFIQDINPAEISKMAKLFDFEDFSITWCSSGEDSVLRQRSRRGNETSPSQGLQILKPTPNEVFYIRQDIPLELQEIILEANQDVEWTLNSIGVGYGKIIFIQPEIGSHTLEAKNGVEVRKVQFEVQSS
ncbi:MAG: hypothetical protein KDD43_05100, partial [Bdellovibrionales bacterium]|nr:hypothetical protein [Bdellovibrionales bacterium]